VANDKNFIVKNGLEVGGQLIVDGSGLIQFPAESNTNAATASALETARNIALTGAVTGDANFDGSANITITTTATSDPTLTINGDASGSATFTNLGNATLTLTIADDSHNHVISNVDGLQDALDAKVAETASTGSAVIPVGTELQRDASPAAGYFRFNSDTSKFEGYDGIEWGEIAGGGGGASFSSATVIDITTTTTGTTFDLGEEVSDALVSLNGAWVSPNDFSFSGNNIVFGFSLEIDDQILVYPIIQNIDDVQVVDNLTSTDIDKALSANQGSIIKAALDLKAPLASPALSGVPTAPTANAGTNTTQVATTAFVQGAVSSLVDAAPATLDTLNELAAALGDDPNFATTVSNQIGAKLDSSAYTASDVLTKIKTVDGALSGLDADLLDGQHASEFAAASHSHAISDVTGLQTALDNKVDDSQLATAATANSVAQRTSDGSINVTDLNAVDVFATTQVRIGSATDRMNIGPEYIQFRKDNANKILIGNTSAALGTGDGCIFYLYNTEPFRFNHGPTERMRIDASGNVGIGTSSPAERLDLGVGGGGVGFVQTDSKHKIVTSGKVVGTEYHYGDGTVYGYNYANVNGYNLNAVSAVPIIFHTNNTERMRITSSGNVGIGTSAPAQLLTLSQSSGAVLQSFISDSSSTAVGLIFGTPSDTYNGQVTYNNATQALSFVTNSTTRMRIDSSGNVMVGKTSLSRGSVGPQLEASGGVTAVVSGDTCFYANRLSSDGIIMDFRKSGTTVGVIGCQTLAGNPELFIGNGSNIGLAFEQTGIDRIFPCTGTTGAVRDSLIDFGASTARFNDIYATNGTIQTSDRNEKQDIEELSEAEHRVAAACKGLLRKFRWISSVEEKGDDARIHFGIIAQDLQAAFEAEGLDAGRYAMFIHTDWWEHEVEVPAVEAQEEVVDEDGNIIQEAVEGKEAYTRTDTYYSEAEAPEGSVKKSRMGVRYSELLAFIIAGL
jgi:hypothetical protein